VHAAHDDRAGARRLPPGVTFCALRQTSLAAALPPCDDPRMRLALSSALCVSLFACGDDGGTRIIDAPKIADARVCGGLTGGAADFIDYDASFPFIEWAAPLAGMLSDGNQMFYRLEFYGGIEPTLSGTFNLTQGNQANYQTCAVCIRAFAVQGQNIIRQYFQNGGSITLSEDPFTNKHLVASITGLTFEEVTVDQSTFHTTPVPGGLCGAVADTSIDRDSVPKEWTCPHADYEAGGTCNCMCGLADPDCATDTLPVAGCTDSTNACIDAACVARPANDTCATATALTINDAGGATAGTTNPAKRNYSAGLQDATACTGKLQPGRDVVYSVTLAATTQYTVTLSNVQGVFDGSISLVGPGDATICDANPITTCVKGADAVGLGQGETFTYTTAGAGNYFIIVDSSQETTGTFSIAITQP
jgi:hypothetical protein